MVIVDADQRMTLVPGTPYLIPTLGSGDTIPNSDAVPGPEPSERTCPNARSRTNRKPYPRTPEALGFRGHHT
jgi:hypothetical protein